jgi:CBS domain-containing protein
VSTNSTVLRVSDIMSNGVLVTFPLQPISEVVEVLVKNDVGSMVVKNPKTGYLEGIITKGDILRKVLLKELDPKKTTARRVMSFPVVTIESSATVEEASKLMIQKKVSKLPVVDDGKLNGIITSTDIIRTEPAEIGYLQELIRARFVPHDLR